MAENEIPHVPSPYEGKRLTVGNHFSIASFWFGSNVLWAAFLVILLPKQMSLIGGAEASVLQGKLIGIGAWIALIVPLLIGPISDRCRSPWGRRRPFLTAGTIVNLLGLFIVYQGGVALSFELYLVGFLVMQLGNNIATGAFPSMIPDLIPENQRGVASGYMAFMTQLGTAVGAVAAGLLARSGNYAVAFVIIGACLAGSVLISLVFVKENPLVAPDRLTWTQYIGRAFAQIPDDLALHPHRLLGIPVPPRCQRIFARFIRGSVEIALVIWGYVRSLFEPLIKADHRDFRWVWITRALVMLGFYIVQPNLYFYLRDVIKVPDPDGSTVGMILLVLIGATITGLVGGHLSERVGRKPIVYAANGIMAAMAMAFPFCTGYTSALAVAIIFGLGYGAYVSVDWALGTDVLPDKAHAGKDMAVWHVAMVFPQAVAAPVAGYVLRYFGTTRVGEVEQYQHQGFQAIFAMAAVFLVLGGVLLRNVKGAR